MLWHDIQTQFPNIDHLKYHWGPRIMFMMNNEHTLYVTMPTNDEQGDSESYIRYLFLINAYIITLA